MSASLITLLAIAGTLMAGTMSPGPSFLFVVRNSVALSRQHGIVTAMGLGTGSALFSVIALLGLHAVFIAVPFAFVALKVLGGLYLLYLAYQILRGAQQPIHAQTTDAVLDISLQRIYAMAFLTQISNPKTAIFFASIFSALLPAQVPGYFFVLIPLLTFLIDICWFTVVAMLLSSASPRQVYLRCKAHIDRTMACLLGALGLKLLLSSR